MSEGKVATIAADIPRAKRSHLWQRAEGDHYVEAEWCSERLFDVEPFEGTIWDPACGFGRIPKAAKGRGLKTYASDLVDRGYDGLDELSDFFAREDGVAPNVISNPPFVMFKPFALKALSLRSTRKVALIWLVRRLNAAQWLEDTPLARVWLLRPRPSMPPAHVIARGDKPGNGSQDFAWLVWDKQHRGPPTIGWLHRDGAIDSGACSRVESLDR